MEKIQYDGTVQVAVGRNRADLHWRNEEWTWGRFAARLETPARTEETAAEYARMAKSVQAEKKDVGGFVGGYVAEGRRKAGNILCRSMVTLDMDFAPQGAWELFQMVYGNAAAMYSTHSHRPEKPRLRLVLPLSREVGTDEYEAVARYVAGSLGIDYFDDTTYQPERLMYWPSASKDGAYEFHAQDGPWLDPEEVLSTYRDWRDTSEWPVSSRAEAVVRREVKKQGDPTEKQGIVGAFCRTYDIASAIAAYLPDVYAPCEGAPGRYTYLKGSTAAGLVTYEGGKFAYSHHGTDPCCGKLCNAFDLVRVHLFGTMDEDFRGKDDKLSPSFRAMAERAAADKDVAATVSRERLAAAREDFADVGLTEEDAEWMAAMDMDRKGNFKATPRNFEEVLAHDPRLAGRIALNLFSGRICARGRLPWRLEGDDDPLFRDDDASGLFLYISKEPYGMVSKANLQEALNITARKNAYHPVREYLEGLRWDGKPRLDYLFVTFLGVEDTEYARAVTRKAFTAAVARVMRPGTPFDHMLVLVGPQGAGKSKLLARMAVRPEWFTDSFVVEGKEARENIKGKWIVESSELDGLKKSEATAAKSFISRTSDSGRDAYDRYSSDAPRQCVFFGTTNEYRFLKDETGNRRFWPLEIRPGEIRKRRDELDDGYLGQLWAEAVERYKGGEPLFLSGELEKKAQAMQEEFAEDDERIGMIADYLDRALPADWDALDAFQRREAVRPGGLGAAGTLRRDRVCLAEIWCECFGRMKGDMKRGDSVELGRLMRKVKGWEPAKKAERFGPYGVQKGYVRTAAKGPGKGTEGGWS